MILTCPSCEKRFQVPEGALGKAGRKVRCSSCHHVWFQAAEEPPEATEEATAPVAEVAEETTAAHGEESVEAAEIDQRHDTWAPSGAEEESAEEESDEDVEDSVVMPWPAHDDTSRGPATFDISEVVGTGAARPPTTEARGGGGLWILAVVFALVAAIVIALYLLRDQVMLAFPGTIPAYVAAGLLAPASSQDLRLDDVSFEVEDQGADRVLVVTGRVRNTGEEMRQLPLLRGELLDADGQVVSFWLFSADERLLGPGQETTFRDAYKNPPISGTETDLFVTFADLR